MFSTNGNHGSNSYLPSLMCVHFAVRQERKQALQTSPTYKMRLTAVYRASPCCETLVQSVFINLTGICVLTDFYCYIVEYMDDVERVIMESSTNALASTSSCLGS